MDETPLCVDLDGTLLRSDLLYESALEFVRKAPWRVFVLFVWLFRGRAFLKSKLAESVELNPASLPFIPAVLEFLRAQRVLGRRLLLVTASNVKLASAVADFLGIFSEVVGSDRTVNLRGERKARFLVDRFGLGGFDYVGNDWTDVAVWRDAASCVAVTGNRRLVAHLSKLGKNVTVLSDNPPRGVWFRALRCRQWVKNLLVFLPLFMAHLWLVVDQLVPVVLAFFSFCFTASGGYLFNDMLDLSADRAHPEKQRRPLASGQISLPSAVVAMLFLLAAGGFLAYTAGIRFLGLIALYLGLTIFYSWKGKQIPVFDILLLAGLYTLRVFAGGVAANVLVSKWLLAFSMFIFLSLAALKRFSELTNVQERNGSKLDGRGYVVEDLEQLAIFGSASGYLAVLVMALYVSSQEVTVLYHSPAILWLVCPVLLYWISRAWLLARRGAIHEDPVVFATTDGQSYIVGCLLLLIIVAAL